MDFKVGDVVVLNSGGLQMTIAHILKYDVLRCIWFDLNKEVKTFDFPNESVKKIT